MQVASVELQKYCNTINTDNVEINIGVHYPLNQRIFNYFCLFSTILVQVASVELQKNGVTINTGIVEVDNDVPTIFGCNIIPSTSRPPPTVIWYIGSTVKQQSTTSTSYTVTASETDHDQRIYCKAYNLQPESQAVESSKPKLYVRGKVEINI